jgi:hypothetical protein
MGLDAYSVASCWEQDSANRICCLLSFSSLKSPAVRNAFTALFNSDSSLTEVTGCRLLNQIGLISWNSAVPSPPRSKRLCGPRSPWQEAQCPPPPSMDDYPIHCVDWGRSLMGCDVAVKQTFRTKISSPSSGWSEMRIQAVRPSETLVSYPITTRRHKTEDRNLI